MKKSISAILVSAAVLLIFTGCGSSKEQQTTENESSQAVSEEQTASEQAPADDNSQYMPTGSVDFMNYTIKDLDLNDVQLSDYIKDNKVTMLNIWGTFCGPCINEMPDLGELERKYKDQGFEIVGLTCDVADQDGNFDEEVIADARAIIDHTKITYPVLVCPVDFLENLGIQAVPTTYFVDSEGNILGNIELGSNAKEIWEQIITGHLNEG